MKPIPHTRRRSRGPLGLAGVLLGALAATACAPEPHPLLREDIINRQRQIEMTRLEHLARSPPVSVEQARRESPAAALPPEPVGPELDLQIAEVRKTALENNLDIRVQLLAPALARENVEEAAARFESLFFASLAQSREEPPDSPNLPGVDTTTTQGELGFDIPLQTGGTATISLSGSRLEPEGAATSYANLAGFSISQPLLRGAGSDYNNAPITIARLQLGQEEARTRLAVMRVLADAESAYWQHYAAARILQVRHDQYQRAQEQLRQARRLAQSGVIARIEVTRAQSGVARRVDDIIRAETLRRSTERELKRIMRRPGLDLDSETVLRARTEPRPLGLELDVQALAAAAISDRMDMLELELQLAVDALSLDQARNEALPLVSLDYSFSYLGNESALDDTLDNAFAGDRMDWRLGARLELPLGNDAAEARRRQAMLRKVLTLTTRDQRAQSIRRDVFSAADLLQEAWRRILAAREETLLAASTYEAESRQFLAGVRTSTDVLQAADFLAEAQIREISALAEYEIAKVSLAFAAGRVLGYGQVRLLPPGDDGESTVAPYAIEYAPTGTPNDASLPESVLERTRNLLGTKAPATGAARP